MDAETERLLWEVVLWTMCGMGLTALVCEYITRRWHG